MFLLTVVLSVFLLILYWGWKNRESFRLYVKLGACYNTVPILEHWYHMSKSKEGLVRLIKNFTKHAFANGGFSSLWILHKLYVVVANAEDAELILKQHLEKDEIVSRVNKIFLGNSMIFAPVTVWRPRRRAMVSLFSHSNVLNFQSAFAHFSGIFAEKLRLRVGEVFCVYDYCNAIAFDSTCKTILGLDLCSLNDPQEPLREAVNFIMDMISNVLLWIPGRIKFLRKRSKWWMEARKQELVIRGYIKQAIEKCKAVKKIKETVSDDNKFDEDEVITLLSLSIHQGRHKLDSKALREEALLLLMAATDTSSIALSFTILMLSWYPLVQDKAYKEVTEVLEGSDRPVTAEDLARLKYLDAVIKESQRLYPPGPVIGRQLTSDFVLSSGLKIVKGTNVFIDIWGINRNPRHWGPDADQFRPERFLEDQPLPSAFVTFSSGQRGCPGTQFSSMLIKTALAVLLREFRVLPALDATAGLNSNAARHHNLRLLFSGTMKADRFPVRLELRHTVV